MDKYYTIKRKLSNEEKERLMILAGFALFDTEVDNGGYMCIAYGDNKILFTMKSLFISSYHMDKYITYERAIKFFKDEIFNTRQDIN